MCLKVWKTAAVLEKFETVSLRLWMHHNVNIRKGHVSGSAMVMSQTCFIAM